MENLSSPIFAALPAAPQLGDAISFLLAGFSVVMLTLLALAVICSLVGALFRAFPALASAGVDKTPAKQPVAPRAHGVDEKVIAVIGAAVDQAMGGRYRINSVTPVEKKK